VPRVGEVTAGVAGRGVLAGDNGVFSFAGPAELPAMLSTDGEFVVDVRGGGIFFCWAVDAVSSAAWRIAELRGDGGVASSCFGPGPVTPAEAATAAALEGVPPAGAITGALAGVVVTDVAVVATSPMASFTSPNSFQSSSCSRSCRERESVYGDR
jgi:hypothetical protein